MRTIVDEYITDFEGQEVKVKVVKPKEKVKKINRRRLTDICPECGSKLVVNKMGAWECTGNMLKTWENLLDRYYKADDRKKIEILSKISDVGKFEELSWRWEASMEKDGPEFSCGYTNRLYPPIASNKSRLPDPLFVKRVERQIGRKLTEEELIGESELWFYKGQYLTKYRKNAKKVKIPVVTLPDDVISRDGI
jgi:hypothetical protein